MEKFDLENFPTSESAKRMLSYVSDGFYDKSYVGKWLYQVMGLEYDEALEKVTELPEQFFVETATWGLIYHEIKWGLPVRLNLPYEERRGLIYQKRDFKAPMTPYRMEELIKTVTRFQIYVIDVHDNGLTTKDHHMNLSHPNRFKIVLEGDGNADIEKIRKLVDGAKQSHTLYDLLYLEKACFEVPVRHSERIRFRTSFYPRFNLAQLSLNGRWKLDGKKKLGGYDTGETIDLYPVTLHFHMKARQDVKEVSRIHLLTRAGIPEGIRSGLGLRVRAAADCQTDTRQKVRIRTGAEEEVEVKLRLGIRTNAREEIQTRTGMAIRTSAGIEAESKERLRVRVSAACTPGVGEIRIYNKNQLSSGWKLNGKRKLNGGMESR